MHLLVNFPPKVALSRSWSTASRASRPGRRLRQESLCVLSAMGAVLTLSGGFTTEAFRLAWLVQYPVWAVGVACLLAARRTARRDGPGDPVGRPVAALARS